MSESNHPLVNQAEAALRGLPDWTNSGLSPKQRVLVPALRNAFVNAEEAFRERRDLLARADSQAVRFDYNIELIEAILAMLPEPEPAKDAA